MKKFFTDFKKFITKGNVMDLAVGVIIGAAFSAIVSSLVGDIIMPLVVLIFPVQDLSSLSVVLRPESVAGAEDALLWHYGAFIQAVINFLLTALIVFTLLRVLLKAKGFLSPRYGEALTKKEWLELKKQGKTKEEIKAVDARRAEEKKAAEAAAKAEADANTTEGLLRRIKALLERIAAGDAADYDKSGRIDHDTPA